MSNHTNAAPIRPLLPSSAAAAATETSSSDVPGGAHLATLRHDELHQRPDSIVHTTSADTLVGTAADDVFVVDDVNDVVVEQPNQGLDTIQASVSFTLSANVENLLLTGTAAINGSGNTLNNRLTGNSAANVLNGGIGADSMTGGLGDDTYVVDNAGDRTAESVGGGTDLVQSSVTWVLSTEIENLTLTGSASINGAGNALNNRLTGNAAANVLNGGIGADSMTGGLGDDTYVVDNAGDRTAELAGGGTDLVQSSMTWVLSTEIENLSLTGSGAIDGAGNSLNNRLTGNTAANVLNGGIGADSMTGGLGNDTYIVDDAGDRTAESAGGGIDLVQSSVTWVLSAEVDNLTLTGAGSINGSGNSLANVLIGNTAANVLNGGLAADTMTGGAGGDIYVVENAGDQTIESVNGGLDTVQASIDWTLATEIENLVLTGLSEIDGTGNSLANRLTGNAAGNILDGGLGADSLVGGLGDDTYIVDDAGDRTSESAGGGNDLVKASISWVLSAEVERLHVTGSEAINATGNGLNNELVGNASANSLNGGAGTDTLKGGLGNDTYFVDSSGDVIVEFVGAGTGTDTVNAALSWTLGANLENLTLTGTGNLNASGNALANVLTGNAGANRLTGNGGNDTLSGGAGNDTYVVSDADTKVIEGTAGGADLVETSVSFTLDANVENLTLTGEQSIKGIGNELNNQITGNAGDNTLNGALGADTLLGGDGNDTYIVDNTGDAVVETDPSGTDLIQSSVSWTLGNAVDSLTLTGSAAIDGTGNLAGNVIVGNAGDNRLDGAGGWAADTLEGGKGDDTYVVYSDSDQIVETANGGSDTVLTWSTYTMGDNVENLIIEAQGSLSATGNSLSNRMIGNDGDNYLSGGWQGESDTLIGGGGGDTYRVDSINDVIVESADDGYADAIESSISLILPSRVENLTLIEGFGALEGTGNGLDNALFGNASANVLDGGKGSDQLTGGLGSDTFVMDNLDGSFDTVTDFISGTDRLRIDQGGLPVGDGDLLVEGAVKIAGPGGFSSAAEFVIVSTSLPSGFRLSDVAEAIGSADTSYAMGSTRLFAVDDGISTSLVYFESKNGDAVVNTGELEWLVQLLDTSQMASADLIFGV